MLKLKPISEAKAMKLLVEKDLEEVRKSIPTAINGRDGKAGRDGKDGKDGVTTTVVKEVLANKEMLLEKDEFEEFKKYMINTEQDIRNALAKTHNYFGGGGGGLANGPLVNAIHVSTTSTITDSQLSDTKFNVILVDTAGITITLPPPDETKLVLVQQNFSGNGDYELIRQ